MGLLCTTLLGKFPAISGAEVPTKICTLLGAAPPPANTLDPVSRNTDPAVEPLVVVEAALRATPPPPACTVAPAFNLSCPVVAVKETEPPCDVTAFLVATDKAAAVTN